MYPYVRSGRLRPLVSLFPGEARAALHGLLPGGREEAMEFGQPVCSLGEGTVRMFVKSFSIAAPALLKNRHVCC